MRDSLHVAHDVRREFVVILRRNADFESCGFAAVTARDDLADFVQSRNHRRLLVRHAQFQKFALWPQLRSDFSEQDRNAFASRCGNGDRVRMVRLQPIQQPIRLSERSILLKTMIVGFSPAPISASTAFTA